MLQSILSWLARKQCITLSEDIVFDNMFYVTASRGIKPLGYVNLYTFQEDAVFLITCDECSKIFDVSVKDLRNNPNHTVCCPDCPGQEKPITKFISLYHIPGDIYQELRKILD